MEGMGRIFTRPDSKYLWAAICVNGEELRKSTKKDDPKEAEKVLKDWLDERGAQNLGLRKMATPGMARLTAREVLDHLKSHLAQEGKLSKQLEYTFKSAEEAFGHYKAVELRPAHINRYITEKLAEGYKPATINRVTGLARAAYRRAVKDEILASMPHFRQLSEAGNVRQGICNASEFESIRENLPPELQDFCEFGFLTGWRKNEVSMLDWSNVTDNDTMIRLRPEQSKNRKVRSIPISAKLAAIIKRRREKMTYVAADGSIQVSKWVFHRDGGQRIYEFRKAWATACKKAGKPGLIFHDLRRSAVTAMVNARVPQLVAMGISGHSTSHTFARYSISIEAEMRDAMAATEAYHEGQKAKAAQSNVRTMVAGK